MTPKNFIDLTGEKFGRLTVIERAPNQKNYQTRWVCRCDCGKEVLVARGNLRSGHTKSCGCFSVETVVKRSKTHGESKTRLYRVWNSMLRRCETPTANVYKHYGGRGISVCDEWHDYPTFKKWMFDNGYLENAPRGVCTVDRIDVNGNYCPENCRIVSMKEQALNRRTAT